MLPLGSLNRLGQSFCTKCPTVGSEDSPCDRREVCVSFASRLMWCSWLRVVPTAVAVWLKSFKLSLEENAVLYDTSSKRIELSFTGFNYQSCGTLTSDTTLPSLPSFGVRLLWFMSQSVQVFTSNRFSRKSCLTLLLLHILPSLPLTGFTLWFLRTFPGTNTLP